MKNILKVMILFMMGTASVMAMANQNDDVVKTLSIESDVEALQYCQLNPNTYIALLYPSVQWNFDRVKKVLSQYATVVYEKNIVLTNRGPFNILHVAYSQEPWIGRFSNAFKGLRVSRQKRFPNFSSSKFYKVRVLLFESDSLKKVLTCKKEIRARFAKRVRETIHINDTHPETITMAQTVFHHKSLNFLNNSKLKDFKKFDQLLEEFKKIIVDSGATLENFCIVGSGVNAAWGLQDCNDLCFIHQQEGWDARQSYAEGAIYCVNELESYHYRKMRDEIIYNPDKHFYYRNVKFAVDSGPSQLRAIIR